ncbi:MAG: hypothetical protein CMP60_05545 [Flavobacteriales bacterium]|nr:hypothetical protein [Flavobacteriales bacterium]
MKAFLEKIAERLVKKFPDSMENIAIVLPSKRSVIFLKNHLSKLINKPIFLPKFFSIEEFIEELSGYRVVDNLSLQFYLYQSYLESPPSHTDTFEKFMSWSSMLLHDFNEVDRSLVDAESVFANLKEVKELENWTLENWSFNSENLTDSQEKYVSFYNQFYNWYVSFNKILSDKNLAYQGMAYKKAALEIEDKSLEWEKVWFVGLNALTLSEQKIIDNLKSRDIARVFWDADQYYYNNSNHEAGKFLRVQRDKWREIDFEGVGNYFEKEKQQFNIIACPKNISQSKVVSALLGSFSEKDLQESKTAVVLADEGLLYPVLNHLPENVKDINVTMGSPLKNTPFYSFIDVIFQMQIRTKNHKRDLFYYNDVLNIINHPLFSSLASFKNIHNLQNKISKKNKVYISVDFIKNELKSDFEKVNQIFVFWKNINESLSCVRQLIILFREILSGKKNSIESEILFAFSKSFNLINSLILENNFLVEIKTLHSIFSQLLSKEVIPFQGEPLKGIQLMGILESRTLDFKNVILLSVNEGLLPKGKTLNSFIPYDLKVHFKMPTYRESDAVFSYHFYRLLQRSENVNVLYNTESDDFGSGEKSRFITQLLSEYKGRINEFVFGGEELEFTEDKEIIIKNDSLQQEIENWSKYVSPSSLNKYINCSLSFYYHYLAKIRKEDEVSEFAEPNNIGTAIHEALNKIYPKGVITSQSVNQIKEDLLGKLEEEFIEEMKGEDVSKGKNYLSLQISKKLTQNFVEFEESFLKKFNSRGGTLNILESEGEFEHQLQVNQKLFTIKGKVDRVDEMNNQLRIIDYKTGKVSKSDVSITDFNELLENPNKSKAFQLLVYAYIYLKNNPKYSDREVIAGNFSFKNLKEELLTVSKSINRKKETIIINKAVLHNVEEIISEVIHKIMNEDFRKTTETRRCEYCDYKVICNR